MFCRFIRSLRTYVCVAMAMDGALLQDADGPLIVKVAEIGFTSNKKTSTKKPWPHSQNTFAEHSCPANYGYESYGPGDVIYSFVEPNMSFPHYPPVSNSMGRIGHYSPNHSHVPLPSMSSGLHQNFGYKEIITVQVTHLPVEIVDAGFLLELLSRYQSNFISANIEMGAGENYRLGMIYIEGMQHAQHIASILHGAVLFEGATPLKVSTCVDIILLIIHRPKSSAILVCVKYCDREYPMPRHIKASIVECFYQQ